MHTKIKSKYCLFCVNTVTEVDYKNWQQLQRFTSSYGKITPKRRNGACSKHQRMLSQAIKRARFMSLLPYVAK